MVSEHEPMLEVVAEMNRLSWHAERATYKKAANATVHKLLAIQKMPVKEGQRAMRSYLRYLVRNYDVRGVSTKC